MSDPVDQMYSVSPFETPLSMMSAFRRGRRKVPTAETIWKARTPRRSQP